MAYGLRESRDAAHPERIDLQLGENDYKVIFAAVDKAGHNGACGLEYHPVYQSKENLARFKEIYKYETEFSK